MKGDVLIRQYLEKKLRGMYLSSIEIERSRKATRFIIKTSRPGLLIGRNGEGATKLKEDILKKMDSLRLPRPEDFKLEIMEIGNPEADAAIVSYMIAEGLEKRMPYRRVIKQIIEKVMQAHGVEGARIVLSGRLGGAEIARTEELKRGCTTTIFSRRYRFSSGTCDSVLWRGRHQSLDLSRQNFCGQK